MCVQGDGTTDVNPVISSLLRELATLQRNVISSTASGALLSPDTVAVLSDAAQCLAEYNEQLRTGELRRSLTNVSHTC